MKDEIPAGYRVMTAEQIRERERLNRENTAPRLRQRVLEQLARMNGKAEQSGKNL